VKGYELTELARNDLRGIADYISEESPGIADQVLALLAEAMERLGEFPELGHLREDLTTEPFRFWPVYTYLVIYLPETRPLQIVRVLSASRDVERLLSG
jgi:plasmid stabilization system protein ParE